MIDNLIALLKTEQIDDDSKREYCQKHLDQTEDKTKDLSKKIEDLGTSIDDNEEMIKTLTSEIKDIVEEISKLDKSVMEATEQRKSEQDEYVELLASDNAAKELLAYAKNRLNKFYSPKLYKAPPKRELNEEEKIYTSMGGELAPTAAPGGIAGTGVEAAAMFMQINEHAHHEQQRDAPEPAPATWGAYRKKGEETTGVIAMIDLLIRDLDKELTEAATEEKNAQKEYEEAMDDAAKKRAADVKAMATKEKAKADAEETLSTDTASKKVEQKELMATSMYLNDLHQECDWLMQNYDLRKSARADEAEALKDAKAVLAGADFSLVQAPQKSQRNLRGQ
jgi:chromosome segregation ATPase